MRRTNQTAVLPQSKRDIYIQFPGTDFQPCGLLTIVTAIQSFSYGSMLAAFGMEISPFNPDALDVSTCGHDCWQKWGEAERNETLLLTLARSLFKFK